MTREPTLWIGGAPGSGKTTAAATLAVRHGLHRYHADTRTWDHRARAVAAGNPHAIRWEELTPAQRLDRPLDDLFDMWLHEERADMIAHDAATSPTPLVVEGTPVIPRVTGRHAVWLLIEPALQRHRLTRRGVGDAHLRLYLHLGAHITAQVHAAAAPHITVTPDTTPGQVVAALETHFRDVLTHLPPVTPPMRAALTREANRAVALQYRQFCRRPWNDHTPDRLTAEFECECGGRDCRRVLRLPADHTGPIRAPGHTPVGNVGPPA
ncbi:hypothetical protein [Stackebrandtia albiflava]|nr:hypothetical protein [Stackebrandtia albiflava]